MYDLLNEYKRHNKMIYTPAQFGNLQKMLKEHFTLLNGEKVGAEIICTYESKLNGKLMEIKKYKSLNIGITYR